MLEPEVAPCSRSRRSRRTSSGGFRMVRHGLGFSSSERRGPLHITRLTEMAALTFSRGRTARCGSCDARCKCSLWSSCRTHSRSLNSTHYVSHWWGDSPVTCEPASPSTRVTHRPRAHCRGRGGVTSHQLYDLRFALSSKEPQRRVCSSPTSRQRSTRRSRPHARPREHRGLSSSLLSMWCLLGRHCALTARQCDRKKPLSWESTS